MERIKPGGERTKLFDHINLTGIFCPNKCPDESFTIKFTRREDSAFDGKVFHISCNACGKMIAELKAKKKC